MLDGKIRVGSLYNKDSKKYNRMFLQGNIVFIEQFQNFCVFKMNFWNNVVLNINFMCNVYFFVVLGCYFDMSLFFFILCEFVLFFYVNKYFQVLNNEQLLYIWGNFVIIRQ